MEADKEGGDAIDIGLQDLWEYIGTDDVKEKYTPKAMVRIHYLKNVPEDEELTERYSSELVKRHGSMLNVRTELESYFGTSIDHDLERYIIGYYELVVEWKEKS